MEIELGEIQAEFAEIIWDNEPVTSRELVAICEKELNWKKSTTYTVLRKLCEKGLFKNENGTVTSVVSKEQFNATKSEKFVEDTFDGSLPAFIAAFTSRKKLTKSELDEGFKEAKRTIISDTTCTISCHDAHLHFESLKIEGDTYHWRFAMLYAPEKGKIAVLSFYDGIDGKPEYFNALLESIQF